MIHDYGRFSVQVNTSVAKFEGGCVYPQSVRISSSLFPDQGEVHNDLGFWQYTYKGLGGIVTASQLALPNEPIISSMFVVQRQAHNSMPLHGWVDDDGDPTLALDEYLGNAKPSFDGGFAFSFHGLHVPRLQEYADGATCSNNIRRQQTAGLLGRCLYNVRELHRISYENGMPSSFVPDAPSLAA